MIKTESIALLLVPVMFLPLIMFSVVRGMEDDAKNRADVLKAQNNIAHYGYDLLEYSTNLTLECGITQQRKDSLVYYAKELKTICVPLEEQGKQIAYISSRVESLRPWAYRSMWFAIGYALFVVILVVKSPRK